jgi:hypothetical protein
MPVHRVLSGAVLRVAECTRQAIASSAVTKDRMVLITMSAWASQSPLARAGSLA